VNTKLDKVRLSDGISMLFMQTVQQCWSYI